jgi:hypothetical protein
MALRSETIPSQNSLDKQLRGERHKAWFKDILLLVLGIVLGGILGYLGFFDWLGTLSRINFDAKLSHKEFESQYCCN